LQCSYVTLSNKNKQEYFTVPFFNLTFHYRFNHYTNLSFFGFYHSRSYTIVSLLPLCFPCITVSLHFITLHYFYHSNLEFSRFPLCSLSLDFTIAFHSLTLVVFFHFIPLCSSFSSTFHYVTLLEHAFGLISCYAFNFGHRKKENGKSVDDIFLFFYFSS
jgi:hypothetical protein